MYPKLTLSRDFHKVSFFASMVEFSILVISIMYMSMACVKIYSLGTSLSNRFHRPLCDDTLVVVAWLEIRAKTVLTFLTVVSIIIS